MIIIIFKVTGTLMVQSQSFFVLLNLDFSCDLSDEEIRMYLLRIEVSEKIKKWRDPQVIPDMDCP